MSLVENQEFATVLLEDLLDEFGSEPGEPVSVGNHKREQGLSILEPRE